MVPIELDSDVLRLQWHLLLVLMKILEPFIGSGVYRQGSVQNSRSSYGLALAILKISAELVVPLTPHQGRIGRPKLLTTTVFNQLIHQCTSSEENQWKSAAENVEKVFLSIKEYYIRASQKITIYSNKTTTLLQRKLSFSRSDENTSKTRHRGTTVT